MSPLFGLCWTFQYISAHSTNDYPLEALADQILELATHQNDY
ncbi:MAG: hypothetical protein ACYC2E_15670 [Sulfuricella sp.]